MCISSLFDWIENSLLQASKLPLNIKGDGVTNDTSRSQEVEVWVGYIKKH